MTPAGRMRLPWTLALGLGLAAGGMAQAPAGRAGADTPPACARLRLHDQAAAASACYQHLAGSDDPALRAEGEWGLADISDDVAGYTDANNDFRAAVAANPASAHDRVRWGLLLHQRFNNTDAEGLFQEALGIDPGSAEAYLGLALVSADGFDAKAVEYATKAAALDPTLAEPHELLAELALEDDDAATAAAQADAALALAPDALDAMATHAAIEVLAGRPPDAWLARIAAVNPHYGEADAIVAGQLVIERRYQEGVAWYRKAIALSPNLWPAHEQLGINLMRLGQTDEPYHELQLCYDHGYRDAATVNSLRLLDSLKADFVTLDDNADGVTLRLKLAKTEADLLRPYFDPMLERAVAHYEQEYQFTPPSPIQVEVYPHHEDFAVRTYGMPGLGALGVTFGAVVAMDSPSGRPPGDFNWATTLWHETDHVFVLTMTNHLVPRWFAEGLAVHEETLANPEWGDPTTPDMLAAVRDHKLLPIEHFDQGFVHPSYPEQVVVSYFQAGRICDYIYARWGNNTLNAMIHDFAVPATTAGVIEKELGMTPADFDRAFQAWLEQQVGGEASQLEAWRATMKQVAAAAQAKDYEAVIAGARQANQLYPDYVYDGSAYEFLAEAELAQSNDIEAAVTALTAYEHHGGRAPDSLRQLATLEEEQGHTAEAAATLDRLNYIDPVNDEDVHQKLGDLYMKLENYPGAEREYGAVVASHPVDVAGANYNLSRAYFAAGDLGKAEDSVLAALERAPDYRPAQQLLILIEQKKGK